MVFQKGSHPTMIPYPNKNENYPISIHIPINHYKSLYIYYLVVSTPSKNISQIGSSSQLLGKIKLMVQTTNQIYMMFPMTYPMSSVGSCHDPWLVTRFLWSWESPAPCRARPTASWALRKWSSRGAHRRPPGTSWVDIEKQRRFIITPVDNRELYGFIEI